MTNEALNLFIFTFPFQVILLWGLAALLFGLIIKTKKWPYLALLAMPCLLVVLFVLTSGVVSATYFWSIPLSLLFVGLFALLVYVGRRFLLFGFGSKGQKRDNTRLGWSIFFYLIFGLSILIYCISFLFVTALGMYTDLDNQADLMKSQSTLQIN